MSRKYVLAMVLLVTCSLLDSCSLRRVNFNEPITQESLSFIQVGHTSLHEVVERLGPPEDIAIGSTELIAEFKWSTTRSASLDLGYLFKLFSPVSPPVTLSGTGINIERLLVTCDGQLVVRSYALGPTDKHALIEFWPF